MTIAQPYIGITGVVCDADVLTIAECAAIVRRRAPSHRLMAGILVSAKTLRGEATTNRRYPLYGDVDRLARAIDYAGAWPVIHYNTRATGDELASELRTLVTDNEIGGVQLNVVSPDPAVVRRFAETFTDVEVILQINRGALGASPVPADAMVYTRAYPGVRHALLDLSAGNGAVVDVKFAARVARAWPLFNTGARLGVAGGLGPECALTLGELRDVLDYDRFSELSFDAESRVRVPVADPIEGERYQDALDHDKAILYVNAVCDALGGPR